MGTELAHHVQPVTESPWLNEHVTDHLGRPATVRRLYDVDGENVAVLTSDLPTAEGGDAIYSEHAGLLATADQPPAFPDYQTRWKQLTTLENALYQDDATEDDARRFRALADTLRPFQHSRLRLKMALLADAQSGDRVYLTGRGLFATILDPDPYNESADDGVRLNLRARLDETHLRDNPHLRNAHPDGILDLSTLRLFPTLGLI
ncbi:hypothetical protein [Streptomyces sp. NPDC048638]|uniref:hypothetical protein n=1 Tax=Streptomyces sp. NPDC048638 TaxID=3365580 RepID=UPI00372307AC